MTFELLVAAVNADIDNLPQKMNVSTDAIIANQCGENKEFKLSVNGSKIHVINSDKRGVGLNRNTALYASKADICLFSDEDLVYEEDYEKKVLTAFEKHPEASLITFNFIVDPRRRTYYNEQPHEIKWNNYGRYPAYALAIRRKDIVDKGIKYSELFGGGAKYSNGEDSLFLHDCLKAGIKMYAETDVLGREEYRESTWFKGFTDKFFFDRGVLYHFLYGKLSYVFGLRFLVKNRKEMLKDTSLLKAYGLLCRGIKEGKTLC